MLLVTKLAPLRAVVPVILGAAALSAATWEWERSAYPVPNSITAQWRSATEDSFEHKERQAAASPVVVNPFRHMH
jgi:hypothetical protein